MLLFKEIKNMSNEDYCLIRNNELMNLAENLNVGSDIIPRGGVNSIWWFLSLTEYFDMTKSPEAKKRLEEFFNVDENACNIRRMSELLYDRYTAIGDYKSQTLMIMLLNWKIWQMYDMSQKEIDDEIQLMADSLSREYDMIWKDFDEKYYEEHKGTDAMSYYYNTTD